MTPPADEDDEVVLFERSVADSENRHRRHVSMVQSYYDLTGDVYRAAWGPSHHFAAYRPGQDRSEATRATEHDLADRAGLNADSHALDIGCGVGGPALSIAAYTGARITGVDLVPKRVREARRTAREQGLADRVAFVCGDATRLPFSAVFSAAYSFEALCHVPDKRRAHHEVARVLRAGAVWTGYDWLRSEHVEAATMADVIEPICRTHGLARLATLAELHEDLTTAGFTDIWVSDAREHGDWDPNWAVLERATAALALDSLPPVLRMMARGAQALCAGARGGAFLIGHWSARAPLPRASEEPA
jgi:sterol 24-C-methyltransferase